MAQAMLLTANPVVKGEQPSLIQRLKPQPFSQILLSPRNTSPLSSSTTTVALFKSKTKAAPAKKVVVKEKPKVEDGIFGTSSASFVASLILPSKSSASCGKSSRNDRKKTMCSWTYAIWFLN